MSFFNTVVLKFDFLFNVWTSEKWKEGWLVLFGTSRFGKYIFYMSFFNTVVSKFDFLFNVRPSEKRKEGWLVLFGTSGDGKYILMSFFNTIVSKFDFLFNVRTSDFTIYFMSDMSFGALIMPSFLWGYLTDTLSIWFHQMFRSPSVFLFYFLTLYRSRQSYKRRFPVPYELN